MPLGTPRARRGARWEAQGGLPVGLPAAVQAAAALLAWRLRAPCLERCLRPGQRPRKRLAARAVRVDWRARAGTPAATPVWRLAADWRNQGMTGLVAEAVALALARRRSGGQR